MKKLNKQIFKILAQKKLKTLNLTNILEKITKSQKKVQSREISIETFKIWCTFKLR